MILVKVVDERDNYKIEEDINNMLKELQRGNKKIIDIKYSTTDSYGTMSALIMYEE